MEFRLRKLIPFLLCSFWVLLATMSFATTMQRERPLAKGEHFPNITITERAKQKKTDLYSIRKKWKVVGFWSLGCRNALTLLPKVFSLQKKYSADVQFIMIGNNTGATNEHIENIIARYEKKYKARVMKTFGDGLFDDLTIPSVPYLYILDEHHVIRHICDGRDFDDDKFEKLTLSQPVEFSIPVSEILNEKTPPTFTPSFDSSIISSMMIRKWAGEQTMIAEDFTLNRPGERRISGQTYPLSYLYMYAFFGKAAWSRTDTALYARVWPRPLLEIGNPELFKEDFETGEGLFNFYTTLPQDTQPTDIREVFTRILQTTFGFDATLERRVMPVWKLVRHSEKYRDAMTFESPIGAVIGKPFVEMTVINTPQFCVSKITTFLSNERDLPFVDDTGIRGTIKLTMKSLLTEWDDVRDELRRQGFDLIRSEKEMTVLVIRDAGAPSRGK